MKRSILLALFLLAALAKPAHADLSASEDDLVVHNLAHFGAGTMVAVVPDFILTRFPEHSWESAWYTRLVVDSVCAAVATDVYEVETNKDNTTRLRHDLFGALGGVVLVGASVHWTF
ncbi:MAG TPA: hypothetical protein VNZ54_03605 [bacterium]|jgi:hypothetical protein|nr:hypothetical protein [bacterium]